MHRTTPHNTTHAKASPWKRWRWLRASPPESRLRACPRCGYPVPESREQARCPECALGGAARRRFFVANDGNEAFFRNLQLWLLLFVIAWAGAPVALMGGLSWMVMVAFAGRTWGEAILVVVVAPILILGALIGLAATRLRVDRVVQARRIRTDLLLLLVSMGVIAAGPVLGYAAPTSSFVLLGWIAVACACGALIVARLGRRLWLEAVRLNDAELARRSARLHNAVPVLVAGLVLTLILSGLVVIAELGDGEIMSLIYSLCIAAAFGMSGFFTLFAVWLWIEVIDCAIQLRRRIQQRFAPETHGT